MTTQKGIKKNIRTPAKLGAINAPELSLILRVLLVVLICFFSGISAVAAAFFCFLLTCNLIPISQQILTAT